MTPLPNITKYIENSYSLSVVESHPDSTHEDLRLDRPFPALSAFCDSLDLDSMNNKDHSHTPWLVLVYKYLQQWKAQVQWPVVCGSDVLFYCATIAYHVELNAIAGGRRHPANVQEK